MEDPKYIREESYSSNMIPSKPSFSFSETIIKVLEERDITAVVLKYRT